MAPASRDRRRIRRTPPRRTGASNPELAVGVQIERRRVPLSISRRIRRPAMEAAARCLCRSRTPSQARHRLPVRRPSDSVPERARGSSRRKYSAGVAAEAHRPERTAVIDLLAVIPRPQHQKHFVAVGVLRLDRLVHSDGAIDVLLVPETVQPASPALSTAAWPASCPWPARSRTRRRRDAPRSCSRTRSAPCHAGGPARRPSPLA